MGQSISAVRTLFKLLRRPDLLAYDPLAQRLRADLGTETCRAAVLLFVDRTFAEHPFGERLREVVLRAAAQGQKARVAAAALNLSVRHFFRCRALAFEALAAALIEMEEVRAARRDIRYLYCARCRQRIAESDIPNSQSRGGALGNAI